MSDKMKVKLYNPGFKNEACGYRNTTIMFDSSGCAEFDASEEDLERFGALGWLNEPAPAVAVSVVSRDDAPRTRVFLQCVANKNERVGTSFGTVTFDDKGMAEFDATAEDMIKLSALGWLVQPQPTQENTGRAQDGLDPHGPTIEEFVAAGFLPENYPPQGYAEKASPGLTAFRTGGTLPWDTALVQSRRDAAKAATGSLPKETTPPATKSSAQDDITKPGKGQPRK